MPAVLPLANDSSPGWTLAYSTSSLTERMGSFALTTSISVKLPTRVIGSKSLIGVIVQVLVYERVGRQRRVGCHQERIAVRRLMMDVKRGQRSVRSRAIFDNDRLAEWAPSLSAMMRETVSLPLPGPNTLRT